MYSGIRFSKTEPVIVAILNGVLIYSRYVHRETIELNHYVFLSDHFHLSLSSDNKPALA